MSKAYDQVEWCFLEKIMLQMGFYHTWVDLIMDCIELLNSYKWGGKRKHYRRDPLSPYLFLLCVEGLSSSLVAAHISLNSNCPNISHLFFVDNNLIFFKANALKCSQIHCILREYERAFGQSINFSKTAICFSPNVNMDCRYF